MDALWGFVKRTGYMFYIVNPREHMFEKVEQVPDYYKEVTPSFIFVIVLEIVIRFLTKRPNLRLNDTLTNVSQGILMEISKIPLIGAELVVYTWIYDNWRLTTLPWDSLWTWYFSLIVADCCFYWMHRTTHNIAFLWNIHEIHHSTEEYNMTVPMRLNFLTTAAIWYPYLPMALVFPPQQFLVHYQLVVIYQYWLHFEYVPSFPYVELIFNTPSLHKVHHGRNRRCIDKNFGSILIIWDRIFGTFEPFTDEAITFGLTTPVKTFNPFWLQTGYFWQMWKKCFEMNGIRNKIFALIKGPGWSPGKPWVGNLEDIPEPSPDEKKYDPEIAIWMKAYVLLHFSSVGLGYLQLIFNFSNLPRLTTLSSSFFIIMSTISFGGIFDGRSWVPFVEIFRCLMYFAVEAVVSSQLGKLHIITDLSFKAFRLLSVASLAFWAAVALDVSSSIRVHSKLQQK